MICPYCQISLINQKAPRYFVCKDCKADFRTWGENHKVITTFFYMSKHAIQLDTEDQETSLWVKNEFDDYEKIFALKHVEDVNPSNVIHWFERLLKLKAFS